MEGVTLSCLGRGESLLLKDRVGIKFHTGMKGFRLLTNDIWRERHTKSTQDDSTSAVRLARRHLFILFMTWEFHPCVSLSVFCTVLAVQRCCCNTSLTSAPCMFDVSHSAAVTGPSQQMSAFPVDCFSTVICFKKNATPASNPQCTETYRISNVEDMPVQDLLWYTSCMLM